MAKLKTVCKKCGENIVVPKDFIAKKPKDARVESARLRMEHGKTKHGWEWEKGYFDKHFDFPEEKPSTAPEASGKKADAKQKLKEQTEDLLKKAAEVQEIKNKINGNSASLQTKAGKTVVV